MNRILKQRIVGAVVLCALGVVFLPALFTMPDRPVPTRISEIPQAPPQQAITLSSASPVLEKSKATDLRTMHQATEVPDDNVGDLSARRWVVQVASYSTRDEADKLVTRIVKETDLVAFVRTLVIQGQVNRVYVGPFLTREDSLEAKRRVDQRYKVESLIYHIKNSQVEAAK